MGQQEDSPGSGDCSPPSSPYSAIRRSIFGSLDGAIRRIEKSVSAPSPSERGRAARVSPPPGAAGAAAGERPSPPNPPSAAELAAEHKLHFCNRTPAADGGGVSPVWEDEVPATTPASGPVHAFSPRATCYQFTPSLHSQLFSQLFSQPTPGSTLHPQINDTVDNTLALPLRRGHCSLVLEVLNEQLAGADEVGRQAGR
jgi:hypothetical protein